MPIIQNPAVAQGFANLAKLFEPPSPQDMAATAIAGERNAKAKRDAEAYARMTAEGVTPEIADRYGVASGTYLPTQSYRAFEMGDTTTRRGQDISAQTSLANNAADNARAVATNAATVAGDVQKQRLQSLAGWYGPIAQDAVRPAVPSEIAQLYGAPGALPEVEGNRSSMSETQWKAAQMERLRQSGQLPDKELIDIIGSAEPPVEATGPDGKGQFMSRGAAIRTGAQPYVKPTNDQMSPLARLMEERDALPQGDPRRAAYDQNIAALGRGQQQSKYDATNDENLAKLNADIYQGAVGAVGDRNTLDRLRQAVASPDAPQGALAGANLAVRKFLNTFGVDAGDTSEAEMINALGNQLALRLRDPANGGGMPGSLSDSDRNFLQSMAVSLGNSPEANRKLVDHYLRMQQKNLDLEALRRDYVSKNGRVDERFRSAVGDYLAKSGIYASAGGTPEGGAGRAAQPTMAGGQIARPTSDAEFDALPAGALYVDPDDGKTYRK